MVAADLGRRSPLVQMQLYIKQKLEFELSATRYRRRGPVKVGIILEKRKFDKDLITEIESEINNEFGPEMHFQFTVRELDEVNPYMAIQHSCQMVQDQIGIFISGYLLRC